MTRLFESRWTLTVLILAIGMQPLLAQNNAAKTANGPFHYRQKDEVTLSGVVSAVISRSAENTVNGSHLILATSVGTIDVSLGPWAMLGPKHLDVSAGDEVSVTGVFTIMNQKQILFARSVSAGGYIYSIRNEHGVALSPQARLCGQATSQNGGAQ
jgi:hypothetical protein